MKPIQLFVPKYEIDACLNEIKDCLEKGWTGLGYKTLKFEEKWKSYTGFHHAHFLNSATSGLNLAFDILREEYGWDDNAEVITTPLTFISTNHAILLSGLKPVFADVDDTLCLSPISVKEHITERTKAVLYVGIGGNTGHYQEIAKICAEHNLRLVLDAAHMAGTRLEGEIPGKEADVVVYSFQAVKNLPTADSGIICFKEERLDKVARKKTWLGINKDTYMRTNSEGSYKWRYDVEYVGSKYHGNSIMASIALAQLGVLDRDNAYRRQLAQWYTAGFEPYQDKVKLVSLPKECESSRHLFQIIVNNRDEIMLALNQQEIYPGVHYVDNTEYRMYQYANGTCPNAKYYSEHVISLPMHLHLTFSDIQRVVNAVVEVAKKDI